MEDVRRVDCSDLDELRAVLALTKRSFASMDGRIDPPSSVHRLSIEDLASGPGEVWVVGTPVTASVIMTPRPDALYVGKLAVDESERGQGLARRLLDHATARAAELGLGWLELETRIELTENHQTFEALGFAETARTAHPGYDQDTSITFRRRVQAR